LILRYLILAGVAYFGYRGVKSWVVKNFAGNEILRQKREEITDVMVQDPCCKVYFPKQQGVHVNVGGEDLCFCSAECRDKFFASRSNQ